MKNLKQLYIEIIFKTTKGVGKAIMVFMALPYFVHKN